MSKVLEQRRGYILKQDRGQKMKDPTMMWVKNLETSILESQTINPHALVERDSHGPDSAFVYVIERIKIKDE
ncbi:MAG: hypothetical protein ACXAEN_27290 [Candidatus Thorarchaeota archaeon]|jgi:hypothetical protein